MNEEHRNALQASQYDICQELDAEDILLYLNSKGVVQDGQVEEILAIARKDLRIMRLVHIIKGAGSSAFQQFINALQICNKECLIEKILAHLPSSSTEQLMLPEVSPCNTFNNQQNEGRMVGGPVIGGKVNLGDTHNIAQMVVHGDYHAYSHDTSQCPSTSSFTPSQPTSEDWQQKLKIAQQSLKDVYLTRFQKVYPFSLPFTFDIENTWVSLALKEEKRDSQATEDHAELLGQAFKKAKMLIIEGNPATGKTSLMRRLAYEWAKGKQELLCYDLVLYAEFRKVRENTFKNIIDLVLYYSKTLIKRGSYNNLEELMSNEQFCEERHILVLLDGYDESLLEKQCLELKTYLSHSMFDKALVFNVVITTRKGYLSNLRGREGRFIFAEVLGFTTEEQKEKYIYNHFFSSEVDNKEKIAAVHGLLNNNKNLNKLAETPLFLTFICLVHERIVDGTLLELYCNIIWWLIDRHQQAFPDSDIPSEFGFQQGSGDKFETIQEHYQYFPQLHSLGNMALRNLQKNIFEFSVYEQFNLQPIIEQVGLLRKEKTHDNSFKLVSSFLFPHRTIQEFLAAFYCLCSNDATSEEFLPNSQWDTIEMNEFERFVLRIALSDNMPIHSVKRKHYFEKFNDTLLQTSFDAFNAAAGFNNKLLNWFLSQCTNVQSIILYKELKSASRDGEKCQILNGATIHNELAKTSNMSNPTLFSFSGLMKLHSVTFSYYTFESNSQLAFTNCPSLKNLEFSCCEINSSTNLGISTLPSIDTVIFDKCQFDLATWQLITDQMGNISVKCLKLSIVNDFIKEFLIHLQKCNNAEKMEIAIRDYIIRQNDILTFSDITTLYSLSFEEECTFEPNSRLSYTNCRSLKNLKFKKCEIKDNVNLGIATLPAIEIVTFDSCTFEANFQLAYTTCTSLKNLNFNQCKVKSNTNLYVATLSAMEELSFEKCTFEINSQLTFTNCPLLKNLKFIQCEMNSSSNLGIAVLPAIDTMEFYDCKIDLATWISITDALRNCSVKCLQLNTDFFEKEHISEFQDHLQKCERIEELHVKGTYLNEEKATANLAQTAQTLPGLRSIILDITGRRLKEDSKEQIRKAGQKRNPDFLFTYVERTYPRLVECKDHFNDDII